MRLGHALVQDSAASAADQVLQAVAEPAMLFEGHQRIAVLPADTDISATAVLALLDGELFCHRRFLRFCVFCKHTIAETLTESQ